MQTLIDKLKAARAVSTPLLAITTPDQPAMAQEIAEKLNGTTPVVGWDRARGFHYLSDAGRNVLDEICKNPKFRDITKETMADITADPASAMRIAIDFPKHTVFVAHSMDRFLNEHGAGETVQAVLNLRDAYKNDQRTLVMLSPDFTLPSEIQHDVIVLDDPLPEDDSYGQIITGLYESAGLKEPDKKLTKSVVRSVRGLSSFEAEQVIAMSLAMGDGTGIDLGDAWKMKKEAVRKIKGMSMKYDEPDDPDISDLKGLDSIIASLTRLQNGPMAAELYVRVDEIDKALAGLGQEGGASDNTGVSQDLHEQFLKNMEDNGWTGYILVGVRGSGKTVLTQSVGKAFGIPTITMDTGAMKSERLGASERAFRDAFRTIRGIGGNRVCVLATCNRLSVLPPELLRRFKRGTWYFDVLTKEERDALWPVYLKKYGLPLDSELPDDTDWTGAEIRNCCEIAYADQTTVKEIGKDVIVPITRSNRESVERMRQEADNNFLSASYPGSYKSRQFESVSTKGKRKLAIKSGGESVN